MPAGSYLISGQQCQEGLTRVHQGTRCPLARPARIQMARHTALGPCMALNNAAASSTKDFQQQQCDHAHAQMEKFCKRCHTYPDPKARIQVQNVLPEGKTLTRLGHLQSLLLIHCHSLSCLPADAARETISTYVQLPMLANQGPAGDSRCAACAQLFGLNHCSLPSHHGKILCIMLMIGSSLVTNIMLNLKGQAAPVSTLRRHSNSLAADSLKNPRSSSLEETACDTRVLFWMCALVTASSWQLLAFHTC